MSLTKMKIEITGDNRRILSAHMDRARNVAGMQTQQHLFRHGENIQCTVSGTTNRDPNEIAANLTRAFKDGHVVYISSADLQDQAAAAEILEQEHPDADTELPSAQDAARLEKQYPVDTIKIAF